WWQLVRSCHPASRRREVAVVRSLAAVAVRTWTYGGYAPVPTTAAVAATYCRTMAAQRITWPDVGLAALLTYVGMAGTGPAAESWGRSANPVWYVLTAVVCLSVVAWRWRPVWTFTVAGTATAVYFALGYTPGPILFGLVVAVY